MAWTANITTGATMASEFNALEGRFVSGRLKLADVVDPAAPADGLLIYSKSMAGRSMPRFMGVSGEGAVLQSALHGKAVFCMLPTNAAAAPTVLGGTVTTNATTSHQQTIASANRWQATRRIRWETSATAGTTSGARSVYGQYFLGNAAGFGGFWFRGQFGQGINLAGAQTFFGLTASTAILGGDPSALLNILGVGYDAADLATGNWFFMRNDGAGAATKVDLGVNAARGTTQGYELIMYAAPNSTTVFVFIQNLDTGVVVLDTSYNTDVPAVNTAMAFRAEVRNGAVAAAANIEVAKVYIEAEF